MINLVKNESIHISFFERPLDKITQIFTSVFDFFLPRNPVTNANEFHLIPESIEKLIGSSLYQSMLQSQGGTILEDDKENGHYVQLVKEIGKELAAQSPREGLNFEFEVVDSDVANAWCLPGGKIAVCLGLIKKMEASKDDYGLGTQFTLREKIGAVLGHEITHATARHTSRALEFSLLLAGAVLAAEYAIKSMKSEEEKKKYENEDPFWLGKKILKGGLQLHKNRAHELEADKYGIHLVAKLNDSKMSPKAAIWVMHFFKNQVNQNHESCWVTDLLATHPHPEERIRQNQKTCEELSENC